MFRKKKVSDKIIEDYLRASYFSVDGLWFVLVESEDSEKTALKIDSQVWQALPKMQVRNIKQWLRIKEGSLDEFIKVIEVKFVAEEYEYNYKKVDKNEYLIEITKCPWFEILKKSNRVYLASQIAQLICTKEFEVWGKEFNPRIRLNIDSQLCLKQKNCSFKVVMD